MKTVSWENGKIKQTPRLIPGMWSIPYWGHSCPIPRWRTVWPGAIQASVEHLLRVCVTAICWLLGCWVQNADVSNLSPEGVSVGFSPPGAFSHFLVRDPPAELEPFCRRACAALSTVRQCGGAGQPRPGCADIPKGAQIETVLSVGNKALCWRWEPEASLHPHPGDPHSPYLELEAVTGMENVREMPHCI